jgi:pyridinium-3,5-biscarboxylic acid mononucleotide sulfurtransferase
MMIDHVPDSLKEFFVKHPKVALAFSGGTDSSYLLYAAIACGCDVKPYYVSTQFQPAFELTDARRLAQELGVSLTVLPYDVLSHEAVAANPSDRCYHCKNVLFGQLLEISAKDGYFELMDGTNASDDAGDRPGMRALGEKGVLSPLKLCGVTKDQIRALSREAGLFTWDKPAYACLATRVPAGVTIDAETLQKVEHAEGALFEMGFTDFRVRIVGSAAKIQIPEAQFLKVASCTGAISAALKCDFPDVLLDLKPRGQD